ncbi:glycosyl hydrolase family 18 protein [Gracilibacillus sp. YIM 98692]|uniref:glycosyl hydrolase family 18 protein n=1 Tax=Gracilibacillus sp. YIM 98692 TaxID=2663532 RepID=UPI0013D6EB09|nr:glycosyl hydrolase family 18 protein [Gracilibacillus sp. YIM 98692]
MQRRGKHHLILFSSLLFVFLLFVVLINNTKVANTQSTTVDKAPSISDITVSPIAEDNQTIKGTVELSVKASDDNGISKAEFYSEGGNYLIKTVTSAPYTIDWTTDPWVPDGVQHIKVVAYDTANQTSEVSKSVLVDNTSPVEAAQQNYKRVGYYASWATYSEYQVTDIDASKLTHINYAFANISEDGKMKVGDPWADTQQPFPGDTETQELKGNFHQLNKLKEQHPHLKTLISVGGWTWSDKFSDVALTEESRTTFADSVLDFMLQYGFDGVDLDWEYPVSGGKAGNTNRPEDKQNYTLLLKKIRETLDAQSEKDGKDYLLTIAAGVSSHHAANMELDKLHQYVDYIQLMTYDIHGEWDQITGLNAPLHKDPDSKFAQEWSVQDAVETYINRGVPTEKMVIGIPFYGRVYNQVDEASSGLYQPFSDGKSVGYASIEENYLNKNEFRRQWESDSKTPYLSNDSTFISYDDVESIGHKTSYIQSMELGGAMMWELSQDPDRVLLTKIYEDLK